MPCLNLVVADSGGHIGWTVSGALPKRVGFSGRTPVTFAFSDRKWDGVLSDSARPSIIDPEAGFLWTANARTVGKAGLEAMGDGGYARPARSMQLRDDLKDLVSRGLPVTPKDLLAIQLDDRAQFLAPWRTIMIKALANAPDPTKGDRTTMSDVVSHHWDAKADTDSVSYRLVRAFRLAVAHRVFDPIYSKPVEREPLADWTRTEYEAPLRRLVDERPMNMLDAQYGSWDDLLLSAADDVASDLRKLGLSPDKATWGLRNTAAINQPFARVMPHFLVSWLSMPADPLPGDADMPRVQGPAYGASMRFAVSARPRGRGNFSKCPAAKAAIPFRPTIGPATKRGFMESRLRSFQGRPNTRSFFGRLEEE